VARISGAKVVFYEKGLQPAVDDAVKNNGPDHVVDAAGAVHLRHGDSSENDDVDPHFWLDPHLLAKAADAFTAEMSKADPDHAAEFTAANDGLQRDLVALDGEYRAGLRSCTTRTLVVSHDAFEYLGSRYDLRVHSIAGLSPDAEPSAKHLSELADLIRTDKITTVFSERLASPKLADTLAGDLGIRTAVLDPIEGLTSSNRHDDYLTLMRANLKALREAGGCS
jgi:zinc transport system substrate-binding protein